MAFPLLGRPLEYLQQLRVLRHYAPDTSLLFQLRKHLGELGAPLQAVLSQFQSEVHIFSIHGQVSLRKETVGIYPLSWGTGQPHLPLGTFFVPLSLAVVSVRPTSPSSSTMNR